MKTILAYLLGTDSLLLEWLGWSEPSATEMGPVIDPHGGPG